MNLIFQAASEIEQFCRTRGWRSCIIGGLAAIRWGEPRGTSDVDLALMTGFGDELTYVEEILAHFRPRLADAANFALQNRVLLIAASNGVPVDIGLAGIPYEERLIQRATPFEFASGVSLTTCSAEDLIVLKAFADRPSDWAAIEGVILRQGARLDWQYVRAELAPLCELKESMEIVERLEELRRKLQAD